MTVTVKVEDDGAIVRFPQGSYLTPTALARVARTHLRHHPVARVFEWGNPKLWGSMDKLSTLRVVHFDRMPVYSCPGHPENCWCGECLFRRKNLAEEAALQ